MELSPHNFHYGELNSLYSGLDQTSMRSYYLPALRLSRFSYFKRKRMELSVVLPPYLLNLEV